MIKLQVLKRKSGTPWIPVNCTVFLRTPFFTEHLRANASEAFLKVLKFHVTVGRRSLSFFILNPSS